MLVRRGDIFYANFKEGNGSVQGGIRPVLILQNDVGNLKSPTTQAAPITSKNKKSMPTHFDLSKYNNSLTGLNRNSIVLMQQSTTFNKSDLTEKIGHIDIDNNSELQDCFFVSWGFISIDEFYKRKNYRSMVN